MGEMGEMADITIYQGMKGRIEGNQGIISFIFINYDVYKYIYIYKIHMYIHII